MYTDNKIREISVSEHKSLIGMLYSFEYIYRFDARYRISILYNTLEHLYTVCVCSSVGKWYEIDHFHYKKKVDFAFEACKYAVLGSWGDKEFDKDLRIIGTEITR